jgi:hypothetical protein
MKGRQEELSVTLQRVSVFKNKQPLCSATPLFSIPSCLRVRAPGRFFLGKKSESSKYIPSLPDVHAWWPRGWDLFFTGRQGREQRGYVPNCSPARFKSTNYRKV